MHPSGAMFLMATAKSLLVTTSSRHLPRMLRSAKLPSKNSASVQLPEQRNVRPREIVAKILLTLAMDS